MHKLKQALCYLLSTIIIIVSLLFFTSKTDFNFYTKKEYKCIISLWQIDTFAGGKGSRTSFLRNVTSKFSKKHEGILFLVTSHTQESAERSIENGSIPDLISYGACGFRYSGNFQKMKEYKEVIDGGILENRYAVSWCKGGYFEIVRGTGENVIIEESSSNSSFLALLLQDKKYANYVVANEETSYSSFISQKNATLISTQRSITKLINNGYEFTANPLEIYNDLYQYISIMSNDKEKLPVINTFIDYLLSKEVQNKLTDINMLSSLYKGLYNDNESYTKLEKVKFKYTLSPFSEKRRIDDIFRQSKNLYLTNDNAKEILSFLKQL